MAAGRSRVERWNDSISRELTDHGFGRQLERWATLPNLRGQVFVKSAPHRAANFAWVPPNWTLDRQAIVYGLVVESAGAVSLDMLAVMPGPITPALLDSIKVNDVLDRVLRRIITDDTQYRRGRYPLEGVLGPRGASVDELANAARRTKRARAGRQPYGESHYLLVADAYLEADRSRTDLAAVLSKRLGRTVSEPTVARWLVECRRRQLIIETSSGTGRRVHGRRYATAKRKATK